tara:strand:+ start:447 stop:737 length:291 start_codon:yes stop_codon:yes gene_type:complete
MIKAFLVIISITLLTACGTDSKTHSREDGELLVYEYTVKGVPLECSRLTIGGSSCNWDKHNKIINDCKTNKLSERTVITKDGETLIFPATKGECGD